MRAISLFLVFIFISNECSFLGNLIPEAAATEVTEWNYGPVQDVGYACMQKLEGHPIGQALVLQSFSFDPLLEYRSTNFDPKAPLMSVQNQPEWMVRKPKTTTLESTFDKSEYYKAWSDSTQVYLNQLFFQIKETTNTFGRSQNYLEKLKTHRNPQVRNAIEASESAYNALKTESANQTWKSTNLSKLSVSNTIDPYRKIVSEESRESEVAFANSQIRKINEICTNRHGRYRALTNVLRDPGMVNELVNPGITNLLYPNGITPQVSNRGQADLISLVQSKIQEELFLGELESSVENEILIQSKLGDTFLVQSPLQQEVGTFDPEACVKDGKLLQEINGTDLIEPSVSKIISTYHDTLDRLAPPTNFSTLLSTFGSKLPDPHHQIVKYLKENPRSISGMMLAHPDARQAKLVCHVIEEMTYAEEARIRRKPVVAVGTILFALAVPEAGIPLSAFIFKKSLTDLFHTTSMQKRITQSIITKQIPNIQGREIQARLQREKTFSTINLILSGVGLLASRISYLYNSNPILEAESIEANFAKIRSAQPNQAFGKDAIKVEGELNKLPKPGNVTNATAQNKGIPIKQYDRTEIIWQKGQPKPETGEISDGGISTGFNGKLNPSNGGVGTKQVIQVQKAVKPFESSSSIANQNAKSSFPDILKFANSFNLFNKSSEMKQEIEAPKVISNSKLDEKNKSETSTQPPQKISGNEPPIELAPLTPEFNPNNQPNRSEDEAAELIRRQQIAIQMVEDGIYDPAYYFDLVALGEQGSEIGEKARMLLNAVFEYDDVVKLLTDVLSQIENQAEIKQFQLYGISQENLTRTLRTLDRFVFDKPSADRSTMLKINELLTKLEQTFIKIKNPRDRKPLKEIVARIRMNLEKLKTLPEKTRLSHGANPYHNFLREGEIIKDLEGHIYTKLNPTHSYVNINSTFPNAMQGSNINAQHPIPNFSSNLTYPFAIQSSAEGVEQHNNQTAIPLILTEQDLDPLTEKGRENICRALRFANLRRKALQLVLKHKILCSSDSSHEDLIASQTKYNIAEDLINEGDFQRAYQQEIIDISFIDNQLGRKALALLDSFGTSLILDRIDRLKRVSDINIIIKQLDHFTKLIESFKSTHGINTSNLFSILNKLNYFEIKGKNNEHLASSVLNLRKVIEFHILTYGETTVSKDAKGNFQITQPARILQTRQSEVSVAPDFPMKDNSNKFGNSDIQNSYVDFTNPWSSNFTRPTISIDQIISNQNIPFYLRPNLDTQNPADRNERAKRAVRYGMIDFEVIDEICKILENKNQAYRSMTIDIDRYQENHPYIEHMCMMQHSNQIQGTNPDKSSGITSDADQNRDQKIKNFVRTLRLKLARNILEDDDLDYNPELKAEICEISLIETDPLNSKAMQMVKEQNIDCIKQSIFNFLMTNSLTTSSSEFANFTDEEKKKIFAMYQFTVERIGISIRSGNNDSEYSSIKFNLEDFALINRMITFHSPWGTWARIVYSYQNNLPIGHKPQSSFNNEVSSYVIDRIREFSRFDDALGVEARIWTLINHIQTNIRFTFPAIVTFIYYPIGSYDQVYQISASIQSQDTQSQSLLIKDIQTTFLYSLLLESSHMTQRDIKQFYSSMLQSPDKVKAWTLFLENQNVHFDTQEDAEKLVRLCTLISQILKSNPMLMDKLHDAFQMYLRLEFGFSVEYADNVAKNLIHSTFKLNPRDVEADKSIADNMLHQVSQNGITSKQSKDFFKNNLTLEQQNTLNRFFINLKFTTITAPLLPESKNPITIRLNDIDQSINLIEGIKNSDPGISMLVDQLRKPFDDDTKKYSFIENQKMMEDETYKLLYYTYLQQSSTQDKLILKANLNNVTSFLIVFYENLPLDIIQTLVNDLDHSYIFGKNSEGKIYQEGKVLNLGLNTLDSEKTIFQNVSSRKSPFIFQSVYDVFGNEIDPDSKRVILKNENNFLETYLAAGEFNSNLTSSDLAQDSYGFYLIRKKLAPYYLQPSILLKIGDKNIFLEKEPKSEPKVDYKDANHNVLKELRFLDLENVIQADLQNPNIKEDDRAQYERRIDLGIVQFNSPDEIFLYDLLLYDFRRPNQTRFPTHRNIWPDGIELGDLPVSLKALHSTFQIGYRANENIVSLKSFLHPDFTDRIRNALDQMIDHLAGQTSSELSRLSAVEIVHMYYAFDSKYPDKNKIMKEVYEYNDAIEFITYKLNQNKAFVNRLKAWSDDKIQVELSDYLSQKQIETLLENKKELLSLIGQ